MSGVRPTEAEMLPGLRRAVDDSKVKAKQTRARKIAEAEIAGSRPVARVWVDLAQPHLDRTFDYLVPQALAEQAQPGVRVKVRFAGRDVDAFVIERTDQGEHAGPLQPLRRVVGEVAVLTPQVAGLVEAVAQRWAGSRADVLRLAIPPRHARQERAERRPAPPLPPPDEAAAQQAWQGHAHAAAFLQHLADGQAPRAVWCAAPGADWPAALAQAARVTLAGGRGVLICVPDHRDVARVDAALTAALGPDQHAVLTADLGPAARYRAFLSVLRGERRVVVGTRAAAFAPVAELGLVVCWDDGDDLHCEPRAPYPHTRETLLLRAEREGAGALVGGFARTAEAHLLLRAGWAQEIAPPREEIRRRVAVTAVGRDSHKDPYAGGTRIPTELHDLIRSALTEGPVLVQAPRTGYVPSLACERCRTPARCPACTGPLELTDPTRPPSCRWCGTTVPTWACGECGHRGLRAPVIGTRRTAEELGRAFPSTTVIGSEGERVRDQVPDRPALVVATPGAEPVAKSGYVAVAILDTWLTLGRPALRVDEESVRRFLGAAGLIRPGGRLMVIGDPALPAVQALVRWDPAGYAERLIGERTEARLPPASRLATITGTPGAVDDVLILLGERDGMDVLGPVPDTRRPELVRVVLRVPRARGRQLGAALGELRRARSARKLDPVRIQLDPPDL